MIFYINCAVLDEEREHVVLLTKTKGPAFLVGKDNFPGGKMEPGESPAQAAIREVREETGLLIPEANIALLREDGDAGYHLYTLVAVVPREVLLTATTMEEEPVRIQSIASALQQWREAPQSAAPDMPMLLVMARDYSGLGSLQHRQGLAGSSS